MCNPKSGSIPINIAWYAVAKTVYPKYGRNGIFWNVTRRASIIPKVGTFGASSGDPVPKAATQNPKTMKADNTTTMINVKQAALDNV